MKLHLRQVAAWFTDTRRQALQALIATSTTLLVIVGGATSAQASAIADLGAAGLIALQGIIGLSLLRRSEWATWFDTKGRGLIYSVAVAAGVAGAAFHLWGDDAQGQIAAVATAVLSILTAFVQVLNTQTVHPDLAEISPTQFAQVIESEHVPSIEADPATYGKERDPDWAVPLLRNDHLRVVVIGARERVSDSEMRDAIAPYELGGVTRVSTVDGARGISADVVLSTIPLSAGLVRELSPIVDSSYVPDPIRYLP
ncbi:hypothetical protein [Microbacterium arborescens]